mgnify:CR=1 FL=1
MNDSSALVNGDLIEPAQVYQASGMLNVQLGIPITAAIALLRAHASTAPPAADRRRTRRHRGAVAPDQAARRARLTRGGGLWGAPHNSTRPTDGRVLPPAEVLHPHRCAWWRGLHAH